jgi:hypothetical protein
MSGLVLRREVHRCEVIVNSDWVNGLHIEQNLKQNRLQK